MTRARLDPARLQRTTQGPGQSTGCRGDQVVERGGARLVLPRLASVVLGDLVVDAEGDGLPLRGQEGVPQRALEALDPDSRDVGWLRHHWTRAGSAKWSSRALA